MKRYLIVGPNGGASFGAGGGSYVALKIAETFLNEPDSMVGLVSLWGVNPRVFIERSGIKLPLSRVRSFSLYESNRLEEPSVTPVVTPYFGAILFNLVGKLSRTIRRFDPDLVVFNDDTPRLVETLGDRCKSVLYANFPYACRGASVEIDSAKSKSPLRRASELLAKPFMSRIFEMDKLGVDWAMANSRVTWRYMRDVMDGGDISIVNPPVEPFPKGASQRKDLLVSIGAVQPNKRYEDILEALRLLKFNFSMVIIGHLRDYSYYSSLMRKIKSYGLENRVRIITNASRRTMQEISAMAKVIVHASRFEPFGISVAEGMGAGTVPVVYQGDNSGPWLDITDEGRFGFGFKNPEELSTSITDLLQNDSLWEEYSKLASNRSKVFTSEAFSQKFRSIIDL